MISENCYLFLQMNSLYIYIYIYICVCVCVCVCVAYYLYPLILLDFLIHYNITMQIIVKAKVLGYYLRVIYTI